MYHSITCRLSSVALNAFIRRIFRIWYIDQIVIYFTILEKEIKYTTF